jgi:hypothetical protein
MQVSVNQSAQKIFRSGCAPCKQLTTLSLYLLTKDNNPARLSPFEYEGRSMNSAMRLSKQHLPKCIAISVQHLKYNAQNGW